MGSLATFDVFSNARKDVEALNWKSSECLAKNLNLFYIRESFVYDNVFCTPCYAMTSPSIESVKNNFAREFFCNIPEVNEHFLFHHVIDFNGKVRKCQVKN